MSVDEFRGVATDVGDGMIARYFIKPEHGIAKTYPSGRLEIINTERMEKIVVAGDIQIRRLAMFILGALDNK